MAEPDSSTLRDVGALASWAVSSAKPGYGVEHLRDGSTATLWQSEGAQPHLISIQFPKKQTISQVWLYADVTLDDSYTPAKVAVRAGSYHGDLQEVKLVEFQQPKGWQVLKLGGSTRSNAEGGSEEDDGIRAHLLQIAIISNHMNGKDTHLRGLKVLAPRPLDLEDDLLPFKTVAFQQHETIR
ncbi:hypothetical protein JCM10213_006570 [Rhodosporidiobolus nylandii]